MNPIVRDQARQLFDTVQEIQRRVVVRNARFATSGIGHDLSIAQMTTLAVVRDRGPMSLKDLAAATRVSAASASSMVERLVEWGLVRRDPDPDDRRAVRISLTPTGTDAVENMEEAMLSWIAEVIEAIGPEYARQWCEVYDRIRAVALRDDVDTPQGIATRDEDPIPK